MAAFAATACYTLCLKKVYPLMFDNNFGKCRAILKILSPIDCWKLLCNTLQRFPPHLQYVATLPCEIRKSKKNVAEFSRWT